MKHLLLALFALLPACATEVYHPTKSEAEMQVDIDQCTDWANNKYWMDPIAALYNAYDCLEAKGYKRGHKGLTTKVEKSMSERKPAPRAPTQPCVVPCRR